MVLEGIKSKNFASSRREPSIFFACHQLSCFFSTPGAYNVRRSGELCQMIIFITRFLIVLCENESYVPFLFMFQALFTEIMELFSSVPYNTF
jgi:hypothetical protein